MFWTPASLSHLWHVVDTPNNGLTLALLRLHEFTTILFPWSTECYPLKGHLIPVSTTTSSPGCSDQGPRQDHRNTTKPTGPVPHWPLLCPIHAPLPMCCQGAPVSLMCANSHAHPQPSKLFNPHIYAFSGEGFGLLYCHLPCEPRDSPVQGNAKTEIPWRVPTLKVGEQLVPLAVVMLVVFRSLVPSSQNAVSSWTLEVSLSDSQDRSKDP